VKLIIPIIPKLGYWNFFYALWYKFTLKIGIRSIWFSEGKELKGPFFNSISEVDELPNKDWRQSIITKGDELGRGIFTYFSFHKKNIPSSEALIYTPNWFYNPFDQVAYSQQQKHWTKLSDFGEGDIKIIWEISRFDWVTDLARAYKVSGDEKYLSKLNMWLADWSKHNPLNIGPNWKCGQEASFRIMKLLTAAHCLDQYDAPPSSLKEMVKQHVLRIYPNINYAISQDNNHGTSEAIGLYIGAAWLIQNGEKDAKFAKFKRKGRTILEGRILKLIQKDGTFAQKSMTYHRVVLDTMSFVLHNMMLLKESDFSAKIVERLTKLGEWQHKMTFGTEGDASNFGSNDGAMIENLHDRPYRDFRPSTQLFYAALNKRRIYDNVSVSEPLFWRFGSEALNWPIDQIEIQSAEILDNQILILRNERAQLFMKLPDDTFRPGNDAFHIDFWIDGDPVMIDSGSYSYNAGNLTDYFKSVEAHNTVQFGNHEQMPKISRFLNGKWIKLNTFTEPKFSGDEISFQGAYKDYKGNVHERKVCLKEGSLLIEDNVKTNENVRVNLHFNDEAMSKIRLTSTTDTFRSKAEISLHYLEKSLVTKFSIPINTNNIVSINY
jgi:hypothetical protein